MHYFCAVEGAFVWKKVVVLTPSLYFVDDMGDRKCSIDSCVRLGKMPWIAFIGIRQGDHIIHE